MKLFNGKKTIEITMEHYEQLVYEAAKADAWKERGDRYANFNFTLENLLQEMHKRHMGIVEKCLDKNHDSQL